MALSDVVACMKVEAEDVGLSKGTDSVPLVSFTDQLYVGGLKKSQKKGRLHGCTTAKERISKMPPSVAGKRSSIYRGVTRWTGRYEAHLWDKTAWNHNQNKKGKQVYLGAYDDEEAAARAYDLAALKYWGAGTLINFPVSDYSRDVEEMQIASKEDYLLTLRRKSSASSKGFPKCRRIPRHLESSWPGIASTPSIENKYGNAVSMDGKVDLTGYISWWSSKRHHHQTENPTDAQLHIFESLKQHHPTEPYQLPILGASHGSEHSAVSALTILSRSDAITNFLQKLSETSDNDIFSSTKETEYGGGSSFSSYNVVPTEEEASIWNPDDFNCEE